jgi:hypothetical protein
MLRNLEFCQDNNYLFQWHMTLFRGLSACASSMLQKECIRGQVFFFSNPIVISALGGHNMESTKRSFRVVAAFDSKGNDALALLKDTRLGIDATKGRVSQAGARAGSQLFRTQKCLQDKKALLPQRVVVMIQETTRASAKKKYGYSVEIGPVKKSNRPTDKPFEGTFQSTPTKMAIEEIERTKPSTKSSKTKAT